MKDKKPQNDENDIVLVKSIVSEICNWKYTYRHIQQYLNLTAPYNIHIYIPSF